MVDIRSRVSIGLREACERDGRWCAHSRHDHARQAEVLEAGLQVAVHGLHEAHGHGRGSRVPVAALLNVPREAQHGQRQRRRQQLADVLVCGGTGEMFTRITGEFSPRVGCPEELGGC